MLPASPHSHSYVLNGNGKPEIVLGDELVKSEETEMANNEKIYNQVDFK